jgi:UDP-glucose 4-epimerase
VINVAAGQEASLLALLTILSELLDSDPDPVFEPARAGEIRASHGDRRRAGALLDWEPRWSLREAIDASIAALVSAAAG